MISKDEVPTLIAETCLWWGSNWNQPVRVRGAGGLVSGGADRLDELIVSYGLEIADFLESREWGKVELRLSILVSEIRFRIFRDREDAVQAALNVMSTVLNEAHYRLRDGQSWGAFEEEIASHLRCPFAYDKELRASIKLHFKRPR